MLSYMKQAPGFYRQVVVLAFPIIMQNLITSALALVDTFMLGQMGEVPMAAVTLANIPMQVIAMLIFGVQSGASVLISQYWGKREFPAISRVLGAGMWVVGTVTALFALVMFLFPVPFLSLFGNDPEVIALAAQYGDLVSLAYVLNGLTMVYISAYRSMERPQLGMYILIPSMLFKTFLNWVLIFGNLGAPAMGVRGAGVSTLIARLLELVVVAVHMWKTPVFRVAPTLLLRPGLFTFARFFRYGSPVVLNETLFGLGCSVIPSLMGHMENSTEILAGYTIASNVEMLVRAFGFGIAATASIIIGREIGAGRIPKVHSMARALSVLGFGCGLTMGLFLIGFDLLGAKFIFSQFNLSPSASSIAFMMIATTACYIPLRNLNSVLVIGVMRGGGDVRLATLIDIGPMWFCSIPYAIVCATLLKTGIFWVYLAYALEQAVKTFFGLRRLRSGKWVRDITTPLE